MTQNALPTIPRVDASGLDAWLDANEATADERRVVGELRDDGLALVDLSDEATLDRCDQAWAEVDAYFEAGAVRVQDAWLQSPSMKSLACDARVMRLLRLAYGREPFPFQTLNFRSGSQQFPHSDTTHFHSEPAKFMCGVWLALEDVHEGAGPLVYYPGSHKLPPLTPRVMGIKSRTPDKADYATHNNQAVENIISEHGFQEQFGLIKKGQALIWAANLLHGGSPVSEAERTRKSLVTHYFFEDCLYHTPMTVGDDITAASVRIPFDISAGHVRWPRRNGRPAMPTFRTIAATARALLSKRPIVFDAHGQARRIRK
ncbi:MAG: phytanoyl-CoA dioxygenase family protein [Pseudomonadota bacterium]